MTIFNCLLVLVGAFQSFIIYGQLSATKDDQRAWLGLEDIKLVEPITFTFSDDKATAHTRFEYAVRNAGKSIAKDFVLTWEAKARGDGESHLDWHEHQHKPCNQDRGDGHHYIILPGSTLTQSDWIEIDLVRGKSDLATLKSFSADIVGCINYRTTVDSELHQSGFIFTIGGQGWPSANASIFPSIEIGDGKPIPIDKWRRSHVFTAGRAN
ncbi:hypothetical protein PQJ75_29545 [Rhodoplanes sp. TEM]|uniref:Uncharacterized protein n=1 Tax=Rhodoplanes tepidamans TaxID=200616 RepID=A0ABT5JEC6_RHOTP|nr:MULTISPECIES: hypothetical protein [Rhodoplanes]MDC7788023.1 hypothetical protein [Rhodoplanes tepidamans]MDC7987898.1 hypothetical protein [Rhodoplanes sp. TEM]MDQ0353988.1 hypothetical protein [Rhodoplanes tepidamans]